MPKKAQPFRGNRSEGEPDEMIMICMCRCAVRLPFDHSKSSVDLAFCSVKSLAKQLVVRESGHENNGCWKLTGYITLNQMKRGVSWSRFVAIAIASPLPRQHRKESKGQWLSSFRQGTSKSWSNIWRPKMQRITPIP